MRLNVCSLIIWIFELHLVNGYFFVTIGGWNLGSDHQIVRVVLFQLLKVFLMEMGVVFINTIDGSKVIYIKKIESLCQ